MGLLQEAYKVQGKTYVPKTKTTGGLIKQARTVVSKQPKTQILPQTPQITKKPTIIETVKQKASSFINNLKTKKSAKGFLEDKLKSNIDTANLRPEIKQKVVQNLITQTPVSNQSATLTPTARVKADKATDLGLDKIKKIEDKSKVVLKEIAKRTSGTGIAATIKSASPEVTFKQAYETARKSQKENDDTLPEQFFTGLKDTLPQTVLGIALAFVPYIGAGLSTSYWAAISAGSEIEEKGYATPSNVAIDVIGDRILGGMMEKLFKTPAKSLIKIIKKSFVVEGGTEVAQDLLKFANDYRLAKTKEERDAIIQKGKDYFTSGQILVTAGVGGVSGSVIGGGFGTISNMTQKNIDIQNKQNANVLEYTQETVETTQTKETPQLRQTAKTRTLITQEIADTNGTVDVNKAISIASLDGVKNTKVGKEIIMKAVQAQQSGEQIKITVPKTGDIQVDLVGVSEDLNKEQKEIKVPSEKELKTEKVEEPKAQEIDNKQDVVYRGKPVGEEMGDVTFYTTSEEIAKKYAEINKKVTGKSEVVKQDISKLKFKEVSQKEMLDALEDNTIKENYDGIKFYDKNTESTSYVVFNKPSPIKTGGDKRLTLYHGSNKEFDNFDLSKVGTGEGSQLFGGGAYLTDNKDIADFYAKFVAKNDFIDRYEPKGIFGTNIPIYKPNADELSKPNAKINTFISDNLNLYDATKNKIDEDIKNIFVKSYMERGFDLEQSKNIVDKLINYARQNSNKINNYKGELDYLLNQIDTKLGNEIASVLKDKGYDGVKYLSDKNFEGKTGFKGFNYVVYNTNKLKNLKSPISPESVSKVGGDYLYHGTSGTVLDDISKEGLKPGMRKFTSLSKDENYSKNWAKGGITPQGKTDGIMLRVNKDLIKENILPSNSKVPGDQLNEVLTKEIIPPQYLEIYKNGQWQPLKNLSPESKGIVKKKTISKRVKTAKNITDVKRTLKSIQGELETLKTEAEGLAVVAQEQRAGLNVNDIAKLKRIYARSRTFQEGDIETIRNSKHQELVDRVVEDVMIKYPEMSEQEAFDFALALPTKTAETIKLSPEAKGVKDRLKTLKDYMDVLQTRQKDLKIDEENTLYDEWKSAMFAEQEATRVIEVPRNQLPVGEGEKKVSRLEARVKDVLDTATQDTVDQLGLTTYEELNKKENIAKASEYVINNPDDAIKVLTGEIEAPKGILRNAIYVAMENMAKGDLELARKLASITSTRLGQEIGILSEIDKESPVRIMKDVIKIKEEAFKKKYGGRKVADVRSKMVSEIKTEKVSKSDWNSFINSIKC